MTLAESKLPTGEVNGTFLRINPFLPNCRADLSQIVGCSVLHNCNMFRVSICHLSVTMAVECFLKRSTRELKTDDSFFSIYIYLCHSKN